MEPFDCEGDKLERGLLRSKEAIDSLCTTDATKTGSSSAGGASSGMGGGASDGASVQAGSFNMT